MNFYENLLILDPTLDDKNIEDAIERVKDFITKKGGDILKAENWGSRKLAYTLKKQKKGTYIMLLFKTPPSTIIELEKFFKLFEPLVKFLIIKLKRKEIEAALASMAEAEKKSKEAAASGSEDKAENV